MFNFFQVNLLKNHENSFSNSVFPRESPNSVLCFENILKQQFENDNNNNISNVKENNDSRTTLHMEDAGKFELIKSERSEKKDDVSAETLNKKGNEKIKNSHDENNKIKKEASEKDRLAEMQNVEIAANKREKTNSLAAAETDAIKADKKIKNNIDKAEEKLKKDLTGLMHDLSALFNIFKETTVNKKERDLQKTLTQISNLIKNIKKDNNENSKENKVLLARVKDLFLKFEKEMNLSGRDAGKTNSKEIINSNLKDNIKDQIVKVLNYINNNIRNHEHGNPVKGTDANALNTNDIKQYNLSNLFVEEPESGDKKQGSSAENNDPKFHFDFYRKESALIKNNDPVFKHSRGSSFDEQLNKILSNAKVVVRDSKNGSFSMRLYPESLGRVNINLNLEQGVVLGKFLVESNEAKAALLENIAGIREMLKENGIAVGEFQVNVRDERPDSDGDRNEKSITIQAKTKELAAVANIYDYSAVYSHDGNIDLII